MGNGDVTTVEGTEVPMVEAEMVEQIRLLGAMGYGTKRIARELGVARNTVRRYLKGTAAGRQVRPGARRLPAAVVERACALLQTTAEGNAVVVRDLLATEGVTVALRTLQRALAPARAEARAAAAATVRFETPPGEQLQVDFGERKVVLNGARVTVYFFVATLGFSRRIYVRASLSQRQDEWKLGLEGALQHFGGVPRIVVVDNARALIVEHGAQQVRVHPAFQAFCADRGLAVHACRPYRARTKGKVESGVKYLKRNGIAGRGFDDLADLKCHLEQWMLAADARMHGTTHRRPIDLFEEAERAALRPLPAPGLDVTTQRLDRSVANDFHVDIDTTRYSVPHRLARASVQVRQTADEVIIWHQGQEVARHRRSLVPHGRITDPAHVVGLFRPVGELAAAPENGVSPLSRYGRSLADYAAFVGGAA